MINLELLWKSPLFNPVSVKKGASGALPPRLESQQSLSDHMIGEQRARNQVPLRAGYRCDRKSPRWAKGSLVPARDRNGLCPGHHPYPVSHRTPRLLRLTIAYRANRARPNRRAFIFDLDSLAIFLRHSTEIARGLKPTNLSLQAGRRERLISTMRRRR